MTPATRARVYSRATGRCEYCRIPLGAVPVPWQIDHIIARQHGGSDDESNLCVACLFCNARKGPNIAAKDVTTGRVVRLFDPRRDSWSRHFVLIGAEIVAKTPRGTLTLELLGMNDEPIRSLRQALIEEDLWHEE